MRVFRGIFQKVDQLLTGRRAVDDELFDDLEEILVQADISIHTTTRVVDELRQAARREHLSEVSHVRDRLEQSLIDILEADANARLATAPEPPTVYLVVGVNGVGKTTTIAKLAYRFKKQGKKALLAAADTFRAAAIDQLEIWASRVGVDIVRHQPGADPSAVLFDALQAGKSRGADYIIADTAGRLHTRTNLMEELKKMGRVVERALGHPTDETILVLDATTGQNAINQAKEFLAAVNVTAIALAKLDGTSKGGIVITIKDELGVPIKLIGTGERMEELEDFDAREFVRALVEGPEVRGSATRG
ncbi:MAG: signal recognition particle-docking protein FtsY [Armatimonadetes bacterium]|nr:signal recognition particle-docking protein FtsY [Armatimonadota bacterium]